MPHSAALPFSLRRKHEVVGVREYTSTTETVHGLLRLDGERLVIQWRLTRATDRVGFEIRTDREVEPVRETVVPLSSLAGAAVRRQWWRRLLGPQLVLTAADLRAFAGVADDAVLRLEHPARLVLNLRRADETAAAEFAAEVELAIAEQALSAAEERETAPGVEAGGSQRQPFRAMTPPRK